MALTKNGRRVGMAAHNERIELRRHLAEVSDPNSTYWKTQLRWVMEKICASSKLVDIWDSPLVPSYTTFQRHTQIANSIVNGEYNQVFAIFSEVMKG